jgi:hypothetical protein
MSSSKKTASKTEEKSKNTSKSQKPRTHKGKLIYHSLEQTKKRVGDNPRDIVEKMVTHSEDNLFCKYYESKNGVVTKITVKSGGGGKEYVLTVKRGDAPPETSTYNKKDVLAKLGKEERLSFMLKYIEGASSLSRLSRNKKRRRSKHKSRSKPKKRSMSRSKKRSKSKSKSKSKRRSKSRKARKSKSKSKSRK